MANGRSGGKVLITGGCGFIGSNLAEHFLRKGWEVIALDNFSSPGAGINAAWLERIRGGRLAIVRGDVRDFGALVAAMQGVDIVIHLAGQVTVSTSIEVPMYDFKVNTLGGLQVLEAARLSGQDPIVFYASTSEVYGSLEEVPLTSTALRFELPDHPLGIGEEHPIALSSPNGCSKGACDLYMLDYARSFGIRTIVFRLSCVYGPRSFGREGWGFIDKCLFSALIGEPVNVHGDGRQVKDVLHIQDLVEAVETSIEMVDECRGEAYNIGGGARNAISILEVIGRLESRFGRSVAMNCEAWRPEDQKCFVSDVRKAERDFGWRPSIGVDEGLDELFAWAEANEDVIRSLAADWGIRLWDQPHFPYVEDARDSLAG